MQYAPPELLQPLCAGLLSSQILSKILCTVQRLVNLFMLLMKSCISELSLMIQRPLHCIRRWISCRDCLSSSQSGHSVICIPLSRDALLPRPAFIILNSWYAFPSSVYSKSGNFLVGSSIVAWLPAGCSSINSFDRCALYAASLNGISCAEFMFSHLTCSVTFL